MEAEERVTLTHKNELEKDLFSFKERLKIALVGEFGAASENQVNATLDKLTREGKI